MLYNNKCYKVVIHGIADLDQRPVFSAIFLPKFRGTAQLQNGRFRGNFAAKIANFAVISRSK